LVDQGKVAGTGVGRGKKGGGGTPAQKKRKKERSAWEGKSVADQGGRFGEKDHWPLMGKKGGQMNL